MSKSTDPSRLDSFFNPRRIAIVGASERGMYPAGILRNLLEYGYSGDIYPVNPKRQTVFGLPCYPDVTQTPQRADLAILTIPRRAVLPTLRQCLTAGIPAVLIITAGFAEADDEGRRLQDEMATLLEDAPLTVVGPNCAGLANIPGHVIATRLPAAPRAGGVSLVSQSGALMMALYGVFADRHIGMNRLLSLGNQVDVTLSEGLAYLADDAQTGVIAVFMEGLGDGRAFVDGLRRALIAGKPVVLIKSGRTTTGQRAAATHTAAIAGSNSVFQAVCRQFSVLLVDDVREMLDTIQILDTFGKRLAGRGNVTVVTQSGGMGSLTADLSELVGLRLPPMSAALEAQLRTLPHLASLSVLGNPTDVRGASVLGPTTAETLAPFMSDPNSDIVLLLLAKSAVREQDAATAEAIIATRNAFDKPLVVVWVGQRYPAEPTAWPLAYRMLVEAGVPLFEQSSDGVRALARACAYWRFRNEWLTDPENQNTNE